MRPEDFDYTLPAHAIAQCAAKPRDRSRLLALNANGTDHLRFHQLGKLLRAGDLLVVNDTRVLPARLIGRKPSGGRVEVLLLERRSGEQWSAWLRGSRKPSPGAVIDFGDGLTAEVLGRDERVWRLRFKGGDVEARGAMPLPPYIQRPDDGVDTDREDYQTVYAEHPGAVAAPTAGLHFTEALLEELSAQGVGRAALTLHVGPGTFQPVQVERIEEHRMHEERYVLGEACVEAIRACKAAGGRVVAVGTTAVRVLEHCAAARGGLSPGAGRTALFIRPGFRFRVVDALLTNFHLPRSTLLMLVSAFGGRERILAGYNEALEAGYRFYSYGDAMFVEPQ
jgi:S-adenosylmethionine:tRNA ribosyltransferase-isomerase